MHRNERDLFEEVVGQLTRIANALEAIADIPNVMAGPGPNEPPPEPPPSGGG